MRGGRRSNFLTCIGESTVGRVIRVSRNRATKVIMSSIGKLMNRMVQKIAIIILAGISLVGGRHAWSAELSKPNVILILADDLGAKELACYGSSQHQTPQLDKMAAEGLRFETFYAMPLCTPTRVCLMTGQYGFRNGYLGMANKAYVPLPGSPQQAIGNHFTHADLMKSAGYATAMAGKWQLSGQLPTLIHDAGFDEYRMWAYDYNLPAGVKHPAHEGGKGSNTTRYWHPSIVENGKYLPTQATDFGPDLFNDFVLDFAKRHAHEPFFVYYTSVLTHGPRVETPDPTQPGQRRPAGLKSNLEYLDYLMGKLLAGLKELKLDERTVVIFVAGAARPSDIGSGRSYRYLSNFGGTIRCYAT
jgi:arylsulfatase A